MLTKLLASSCVSALAAGVLFASGCVDSLGAFDDADATTDDGGPGSSDAPSGPTTAPTLAPSRLAFRDADPRQNFVAGDITITPAPGDGGTEYRAYFGSSATARIGTTPIGTSPTTTLTLPSVAIPAGATFVLVFAANTYGEALVSASLGLRDNYAHYTDISGTLDYVHNYAHPSAAIAVAAKQLYVITEGADPANSSYNNLVRCALDGSACARTTLSTKLLQSPTLFVDEAGGTITFTGEPYDTNVNTVGRCKLDGTACTIIFTGSQTSGPPAGAIDTVNKHLYMFYSSISDHPSFDGCNYDGTGGFGGGGTGTGEPQTGVIDTAANKVLMVQAGLSLFTTDLAGANLTTTDIGAGAGAGGADPFAVLDAKNAKLLVAARATADKLALYRCDVTGANCTYTDASSGQPAGSGKKPSMAIDTTRDQLYIATQNDTNRPALYRCNLDGTACAYVDITAGQALSSGVTPKVLIDTVNDRLLVVTQVGTADLRAGLFSLDLW